jgi:hypothetical protein
MPDKATHEPKNPQSFAELLEELPAQSETVNLIGLVTRSPKPGHFRLTPHGGGRHVELPVDAVRGHSVLHREPGHLVVQLEAELARVEALLAGYEELFLGGGVRTYLTSPYSWTRDPHHVPQVQAGLREEGLYQKPPFNDHKVIHTDLAGPFSWDKDPILHKVVQDPGQDLRYQAGPVRVPPGDPVQQGAGGLAPFVLATPHHAPAGSLAMQSAGLQRQVGGPFAYKPVAADLGQKTIAQDPTKHGVFDTLAETGTYATTDLNFKSVIKDAFTDHTFKEVVTDHSLKEVVADPTLVETGGTLVEGGGFGPGGGINQF